MHDLRWILPVLLVLLSAIVRPAAAMAADDGQLWLSTAASGSLYGPLVTNLDAQLYLSDNASHPSHYHARGALGVRLAPGFVVGGGYYYSKSIPASGHSSHEDRSFVYVDYPLATLGAVRLNGRSRLEQRWFSNQAAMGHRFRSMVQASLPIAGPPGMKAILQSEAYVLLRAEEHQPAGFNQLRTRAALHIPLPQGVAFEPGYMLVYVRPDGGRLLHVLYLGVNASF